MISQPMNGLTKEQILEVKNKAIKNLEKRGYEVINTYFEDFDDSKLKHKGVFYLAKSIEVLSKIDLLYCCKGWENARGCRFEHDIAVSYGIDVIEDYTENH